MTCNCIWGSEIAFLVTKHKNVVTLPVSFTGSYTDDEPTSPWQKNLILNFKLRIQRLFKMTTKIQDRFKIVQTMANSQDSASYLN